MGFNTRYISEEKIKEILKEEGLTKLIEFINGPNALIFEDKISEKVFSIIKEDEKKAFMLLTEMGLYGK